MTMTEATSRRPRPAATSVRRGSCAVVWIDGRGADLALLHQDGHISTCRIERGREAEPSYLAIVVRTIGDRERVVILGPSSMRLALEREYVAIHHRPERLIDVEPAGRLDPGDLVRRLRELSDQPR